MGKAYTGKQNLEAMTEAVKYNRFLVNEVKNSLAGAKQVVDFGAGSGTLTNYLKETGLNVACVELDDDLRKVLKKRGFEAYRSLNELKTKPDAIYTLNVLEHIKNDRLALHEIFRNLPPGGKLYAYVPAYNLLFSEMDRLVGHYRRYRLSELEEKLIKTGFEIVNSRYVDSLGFFAALLYKLAGGSGKLNPRAVSFFDRWVFPINRVIDPLTARLFGKNVAVLAQRPLK